MLLSPFMPISRIVRPAAVAGLALVGLWPHFSTPASWLAAALMAGLLFCLGPVSLRAGLVWCGLSCLVGVIVWLERAGTYLLVSPQILLPILDEGRVSLLSGASALAAACAVVIGLRYLDGRRPAWKWPYLLLLVLLMHAISSHCLGASVRQLSRFEPVDRSYNFDGIRYLKSFYLMKRGYDWYEGCVESTRVDARAPFAVPRVVLNYRLPTLYALLSFLPHGGWIQIIFSAFSCLALVGVYYLARSLLPSASTDNKEAGLYALASAILCSPYLLVGGVTWFYTFHEYWAWFAALASMISLSASLTVVALLMAALSASIREHFLLVLAVVSVLTCRSRNLRAVSTVCACLALVVLVYVVHVIRALPYTGQGVGEGVATIWMHPPSMQSVIYSAMFGSTLYLWPKMTVPAISILALVGLWSRRRNPITLGLLMLVAVAALAYLIVGPQVPSGGYWGILYMPWVYIAAPLGLVLERTRHTGDPAR